MGNKHVNTNRLIHQKSPYLLQHAHNPVDWYAWEEEAFQAAHLQNKPIFLSIGYATCHWCHVMARECFEDTELAQLLNETFINIKVDREELPEVDSLYMEFAQSMMSGAIGWPLNIILTPDLQPFFAATYLPAHSQQGLIGLHELIMRIRDVWHGEERETVISQAEKIVDVFGQNITIKGDILPDKELVDEVAELLFKIADPVYGGMKGAPKFPIGYQSTFMMCYSYTMNDSRAMFLAERTLDMMHRGGIYDHLGGGFSRYSVDENWLVPHFEKMLYDNALLAQCYFEAWQMTKKTLYQEVCQEILNYILRDMTFSQGGFYSAEDAESEKKEGYFYTWTPKEIKHILGEKEGVLFCEFFNVTEEGNFEGRNILHMLASIDEFAEKKAVNAKQLGTYLNTQRQLLWKAREKRTHPFKDDKIITSWNGLMIHSMALAGSGLKEPRYIEAAFRAAKLIKTHLWKNGRLLRRWRDGEGAFIGVLDDYASMIRASLTLFEIEGEAQWLEWAIEMTKILESNFKGKDGAFFQLDSTDKTVILRKGQFSDGAEPSGNALHTENLLRLYQLTNDSQYLSQAEDVMKAIGASLENYAAGFCYHMININRYFDRKVPTIVIALNELEDHEEQLRDLLYSEFIPHKVLIWRHIGDEKLFNVLPFTKEQAPINGQTTLYICNQGVCKKPITNFFEMADVIHKL